MCRQRYIASTIGDLVLKKWPGRPAGPGAGATLDWSSHRHPAPPKVGANKIRAEGWSPTISVHFDEKS